MSKSFVVTQPSNAAIHDGVSPSIGWALAGLSLSTLLSALGTSIANVALPTFARSFAASFQEVQWIVLAYLLASTTLVVGAGRLGDIVGRRRLLLVGITLFTLASVLCSVAPHLWFLIAGRALQGVGASVMLSLSMSLTGDLVPRTRAGSVLGLLGTMSAIGTALGPALGGGLIAAMGWRAIFLLNLPLGGVALFLAHRFLPVDQRRTKPEWASFDKTGTLLLVLMLAAYALAMTMGRGRFGWTNVGLLIAAAFGFGLFVRFEKKTPSPLVNLAMVRDPALAVGLATNALVSTVMMATLVVGPFYLSRTLALPAALVGLVMSVGPLAAAATGVPAGRMTDRWGTRHVVFLGLGGITTGAVMMAAIPASFGVSGYVTPVVFMTIGYGLFQAANNTAVMTAIPSDQRGVASGLLNLSRNLGLITGASAMGALFVFGAGTTELAEASPDAVGRGLRITFAVAVVLVAVGWGLVIGKRMRAS